MALRNLVAKIFQRNISQIPQNEVSHQMRCMSVRAHKRFYKNVDVISSSGQYEIVLDSKKLKTPNGLVFNLNSEPLALAVAHEWQTQKDLILLSQMHLTGLCNVCIDNPTKTTKYALVDSILNFLDTDTILFFSDEPPALLQKQREEWLPIINWYAEKHNIDIQPSESTFVPSFSNNAREVIRRHLLSYSFDTLQGITFGIDSIKSLILMCAVVDKKLTVEEAVNLSRLELNFQTEKWGNVEWAHDLELHDTTARVAAAALFVHCKTNEHTIKVKN